MNLVRPKPLACQGLFIPSLYLKVSPINQALIIDVEGSCFFNMKVSSFMVDSFKYVEDLVVYYSHSVEAFFCGRSREFVCVIELYSGWIKRIETSASREFVGIGGCGIVGQFGGR